MKEKTAPYRMITLDSARRFHFFCEASGMLVTTSNPTFAKTEEDALYIAWQRDGKKNFNRCQKCDRLVSDVMFNADVLTCVDCTPWENKPNFCSNCGKPVLISDIFCSKCGARLHYREVMGIDTKAE